VHGRNATQGACAAKWAYAGIIGVRLQPTSTQGIRYGMADVPEGVQYATNGFAI